MGLVLGLAPEGGDEYVLDEILRQRRIPARQAAEEAMHLGGVRGDGMGHPIGWWGRSVAGTIIQRRAVPSIVALGPKNPFVVVRCTTHTAFRRFREYLRGGRVIVPFW